MLGPPWDGRALSIAASNVARIQRERERAIKDYDSVKPAKV